MNNLELVKTLYETFALGDIFSVLEQLDENIEWTQAEGHPYGGVYTGHKEIMNKVFKKLATEWDVYRVEVDEYLDAGDRIVALGSYSGTYKQKTKTVQKTNRRIALFPGPDRHNSMTISAGMRDTN